MLYALNDITIIPTVVSGIDSRSECCPYVDMSRDKELPLFTAPMSCIIDDKNFEVFNDNCIKTIIPRNIPLNSRVSLVGSTFCAFSLDEFEGIFCLKIPLDSVSYICIDIANGHMKKLLDLCKRAKEIHGDKLVLMAGNIANPETYLEYAKVGIDYVRVGIGSGNACTTSANSGVHYPMASLIENCKEYKNLVELAFNTEDTAVSRAFSDSRFRNMCFNQITGHFQNPFKSIPKIIADGGFKNFDQIIKALALGADYCMLGEIFAKCKEACGNFYTNYHLEKGLDSNDFKNLNWNDILEKKPFRMYYGMSTKRAQMELGVTDPEKLKTAEGIEKQVTVDYTLEQWVDNFKHYLRSAMSYTGCRTLEEFSKVRTEVISNQSFNSYYK